ncbi:MAG: bacillithiol system redox-active protein YtxJ [Bacteroidota bacterium]
MGWIELKSAEQVQDIIKESETSPVLVFKHSTTCSISAMALHRLERKSIDARVYYLDLRAHRDVSNLIASTFDVEHESPQVLIIDKGKAVYHRSHSEISPVDIQDFLNSVTN